MPTRNNIATQRDCRKHNSSARKEIHGIMFESKPRKGWHGNWTTVNGRAVLRQKKMGDPWQVWLDGNHVGLNLHNFAEAVRSNEWAIRKGLS